MLSNTSQISPQMSSAPPSKPLMSQNPLAARPPCQPRQIPTRPRRTCRRHLVVPGGLVEGTYEGDGSNFRRFRRWAVVSGSSHPPPGKISARQPLAMTMMARPPCQNGGQNNARLSAPLSKCVKSPAGTRPLVNPRQSPAAHAASCQCVKIRQNPSNLGPARAPTIPPSHLYYAIVL